MVEINMHYEDPTSKSDAAEVGVSAQIKTLVARAGTFSGRQVGSGQAVIPKPAPVPHFEATVKQRQTTSFWFPWRKVTRWCWDVQFEDVPIDEYHVWAMRVRRNHSGTARTRKKAVERAHLNLERVKADWAEYKAMDSDEYKIT